MHLFHNQYPSIFKDQSMCKGRKKSWTINVGPIAFIGCTWISSLKKKTFVNTSLESQRSLVKSDIQLCTSESYNTFIRVATMSNKWVHDFSTSIVQSPALKTSGRIVWQMMGPSISRCSCVIPYGIKSSR